MGSPKNKGDGEFSVFRALGRIVLAPVRNLNDNINNVNQVFGGVTESFIIDGETVHIHVTNVTDLNDGKLRPKNIEESKHVTLNGQSTGFVMIETEKGERHFVAEKDYRRKYGQFADRVLETSDRIEVSYLNSEGFLDAASTAKELANYKRRDFRGPSATYNAKKTIDKLQEVLEANGQSELSNRLEELDLNNIGSNPDVRKALEKFADAVGRKLEDGSVSAKDLTVITNRLEKLESSLGV